MHYFTICARNYLAYALTLRDSILRVEPDAAFHIFLADEPVEDPAIAALTIPVKSVAIPSVDEMRFRYSLMEFSTAIKPYCFDHVFDELGADRAVYIDPDIELFRPLTAVREAFEGGASAVLTPHLLTPYPDDRSPNDLDILSSGTFNLGFGAFANSPEARAFIAWWGRKTRHDCFSDLPHGLFVDQKWVDFAPSFLPGLHVLRDPGYNVAYWNLSHRAIEVHADRMTAGGAPLTFFHFSGVVPGDDSVFSKHQDRFTMANAGPAADLVRAYLLKLAANRHAFWSGTSYAFACFANGTPIPPPVRRGPLTRGDLVRTAQAYDTAYWNTPAPELDQSPGAPITRLMLGIHAMRPDLQSKFPLTGASGRKNFHSWFITYAAKEYGLTNTMMPQGSSVGRQIVAAVRRVASLTRTQRPGRATK